MVATRSCRFALVAAVFVWALGSSAQASSFNFKITGQNIKLGKLDEFEPKPIHVKAEVGKPFLLIAQGRAYPRATSAKDLKALEGIPCEPEAGKWIFDDKAFKVGEIDKKSFDKTQIVIRLEPTVVGSTRIRFVGKVGGYDREFDIRVEVSAALLGSGVDAGAQEKADLQPKQLRLTSHRFRARSMVVTWDGKTLKVERSVEGRDQPAQSVTPSEAAWRQFWKEMNAIGVWKWNAKYVDPKTVDGHSWSVDIERGDTKIRSSGRNLYPAQFERYENAVLDLIGEKRQNP